MAQRRAEYICILIAALLFYALGEKPFRQLDLLDMFFPCLFVVEVEGKEKQEAEFDDVELRIKAIRYHDSLYVGSSRRVSQILGRLCGTARGNQEKERRTAQLMQKQAASVICSTGRALAARMGSPSSRSLSLSTGMLFIAWPPESGCYAVAARAPRMRRAHSRTPMHSTVS